MTAVAEARFAGRLVPARPDLAAAHLEGRVPAARYAAGLPRRVAVPVLDLTLSPGPGAGLATQLLFGEGFTIYETRDDGLCWGQSESDGYVGYVAGESLAVAANAGAATRTVTALGSHVYAAPALKARTAMALPFLARLGTGSSADGFVALDGGGWVPAPHLAPVAGDLVDAALRLEGAPYLWGGRTPAGLDCSALVQLAALAAGHPAPRDSDMQAALLGAALADDEPLRRGDLLFWHGHVGLLVDATTLLHANAHHMAVAREPLDGAVARIAATGGGPVTSRRRIDPLPRT